MFSCSIQHDNFIRTLSMYGNKGHQLSFLLLYSLLADVVVTAIVAVFARVLLLLLLPQYLYKDLFGNT